ncbi:MAG: hypothetical protein ABMA00_15240, partial [Gemmatimonas sp.]
MTVSHRRSTGSRGVASAGAILMAMGMFGACSPSGIASTPASDQGTTLDARLLQMVDTRGSDTTLIDAVLNATGSARRSRAALAIGQVKVRSRYVALRRLLTDADTMVAANAAFALGVAKDTGAVTSLARAL